MSYAAMAAISNDPAFRDRVRVCLVEQALLPANAQSPFAAYIIPNPLLASDFFIPLLVVYFPTATTQDQITDTALVNNVRALWSRGDEQFSYLTPSATIP